MASFSHVCLHTFGYELPPRRLTSDDIEKRLEPLYQRLKLPEGRLEMMSGIRERRLWEPGTRPSQAASRAGSNTIRAAGVDPTDVQCLIFSSVSRDMMEPATASFVHHALGLSSRCLVLDVSNACLGFLDGMVLLGNMIEVGQVENGLVVSGETAEELVGSTIQSLLDDSTLTRKSIKSAFASLTIGSGAVGLYVSPKPGNGRSTPTGARIVARQYGVLRSLPGRTIHTSDHADGHRFGRTAGSRN